MQRRLAWASLGMSLALAGCGDDDSPVEDAGNVVDAGPMDTGSPDEGTVEPDAGPDLGPEPDAGPPRDPDVCDELGLARAPFATDGLGPRFGDVAGDFTVETLGGTFRLSDAWTGCESYVIFVHFPGQTDELMASTFDLLFTEGPRNVQYLFLSMDEDPAARLEFANARAQDMEDGFAFRMTPVEEQERWRPRIHFATSHALESGSIGEMLEDYFTWARTPEATVDLGDRGRAGAPLPVAIGIDRTQRWDAADNLSPSVGAAPRLDMARFLGSFYDYRVELESRLASETDATVVELLDERTTGRVFTRAVTLPDPAEMATFDSLEVDIVVDCQERNPFACSEWDRIASVSLCIDGAACTDRREIARWITPYWRRGRQHYLIEATPMLGLLREGGERHFFVELGPEWERATEWVASVSLRLRSTGADDRPIGAERAFGGGAFDMTYNTREPFAFTPPPGTTRVEIVTLLSGHGQTAGDNCAEWCDHRHVFTVADTALPEIAHEGSTIGSAYGCASRAREGVIPGQWGNWAQSRAYWCPGLPVAPQRIDITEHVRLGAANQLDYEGRFEDGDPRGGDIALSAYVVYYGD